jgi:hypothetical protein
MTKIICDPALRQKLQGLSEPMELCDELGRVLACVWPATDPTLYTDLEPQIDEDELKRRLSSKGKTLSTAEVLTYLEQM